MLLDTCACGASASRKLAASTNCSLLRYCDSHRVRSCGLSYRLCTSIDMMACRSASGVASTLVAAPRLTLTLLTPVACTWLPCPRLPFLDSRAFPVRPHLPAAILTPFAPCLRACRRQAWRVHFGRRARYPGITLARASKTSISRPQQHWDDRFLITTSAAACASLNVPDAIGA